MRVSNLLVLSVLSLIAVVSFFSIPEVSHDIGSSGSLLPASHEMVVKDVLPLIVSRKRHG